MHPRRVDIIRTVLNNIIDCDLTPHLFVNANVLGVKVPKRFVSEEGKIVLNISASAVKKFFIEEAYISFEAAFNGVPSPIMLPIKSIEGIFDQERSGREGVEYWFFDHPEDEELPPDEGGSVVSERPKLRLVK